MNPYYSDDQVQLFVGDCREVLPALDVTADLIIADPPFEETEQAWDRWPDGWLDVAATVTSSLWCFGSMRMFFEHLTDFATWKPSQDVIWEKTCGTSMRTDRFGRIHESVIHWYRGRWSDLYVAPQREKHYGPDKGTKRNPGSRMGHWGHVRPGDVLNHDDGTRLVRSVLRAPNLRGRGIHPTEKPVGILQPLIEYACPPGGLVVDPFAGSGSTLEAARLTGRRAIGIEISEEYCNRAAERLSQAVLPIDSDQAVSDLVEEFVEER